jgi:hypothetical protein
MGAIAWPCESVETETELVPVLENVPLAPLEGALKVTSTPASGDWPPVWVTVTVRLVANVVLTLAV